MTIRRPFSELDLGDQLRLEPSVTPYSISEKKRIKEQREKVNQCPGRDENQCRCSRGRRRACPGMTNASTPLRTSRNRRAEHTLSAIIAELRLNNEKAHQLTHTLMNLLTAHWLVLEEIHRTVCPTLQAHSSDTAKSEAQSNDSERRADWNRRFATWLPGSYLFFPATKDMI